MADLTEAIRLDPRRVDAFYARGIAWYHQKKYDKAIADWDHALELNPNSPSILAERAFGRRVPR